MPPIQVPSLTLPFPYTTTTDVELIDDLLVHNSVDIPVEQMKEKTVIIWATEVVLGVAVPGNLTCWVELSPFASSVSTAFWTAIGGGGGASYPLIPAFAPIAPAIAVATGVNGVVHPPIMLRWLNHSPYARIRIQTPVAVGLPLAYWAVQVWFMAGG